MGASVKTASLGGDAELGPVAEINVTPLVDVMLVLLIIFMVTAPVMMSQLPIALPRPSSAPPPERLPDRLGVNFDLQGNYFLQRNDGPREPIAYGDLPARLRELARAEPGGLITVCADKDAVYDRVVDLMSVVGEAGFEKVSLCP